MSFDFKNNLENLMQAAKSMQGKLKDVQNQLSDFSATGEAGAGSVRITMNGKYRITSIKMDPSLEEEKLEILLDLIKAAQNHAAEKVEHASKDFIQNLASDMQLPTNLSDLKDFKDKDKNEN